MKWNLLMRTLSLSLIACFAAFLSIAVPARSAQQPSAAAATVQAGVEIGAINGAPFRIDIPANYNGTLVMYCHGYGGPTEYKTGPMRSGLALFLDAGYAVAQSAYSGRGWAVKEGIEDTEALRSYFVRKHGAPKRTYVTGHSMGGVITLATIERYPDIYDGALPLCGPLSSILSMMQRRIFDLAVVFDAYFPGVIGSPVNISDQGGNRGALTAAIQKALDSDAEKRAALTRWAGVMSEKEIAPLLAFYAAILQELRARAGGNAFDNRDTVYWGSPDDVWLNRQVGRYAADPQAVEYLRRYYTPTGLLRRPVLAVHNVYDPVVPAWSVNPYGELTRLQGTEAQFVQRFGVKPGHCAFDDRSVMQAFQDLRAWAEEGIRPASGEQK
jgi:pimeloyl-ACP methyl ester carboxylesterase